MQALKCAGRPEDQANGFRPAWVECFSRKVQRYHYINKGTGQNTWEEPHPGGSWEEPQLLPEGLRLVAKLVGNTTLCGSTVAKFRRGTIKTDNRTILSKVLSIPHMHELLTLDGFDSCGPVLLYPDEADAETLRCAAMVAAKAMQLSGGRGFSGCATAVDDITGSGSSGDDVGSVRQG
ncbi:MAG: hypothetical protein WDW36_008734 [Sanguina aurantia]